MHHRLWSKILPSCVRSQLTNAAQCGAPCGQYIDAKVPVLMLGGEPKMSLRVLHPQGWKPPVGYANGISAAAGRIVFIAGQVGWNADQRFQSDELVPQF